MSKSWEFAVSPARLAVIAGCLLGAGLIVGAAGFTAGLILAPRYSPVLAEAVRLEEARVAALKVPSRPEMPRVEVPRVEAPKVEAPKPEVAKAEAQPAEAPKPEVARAEPAKQPEASKPEASKPELSRPEEAKSAPATAAAAPAPAKPAKPPIELQVQVASFASAENAENTVDRLKRSGYPAFAVARTDPNSRLWHVVQVGPYYAYATASKTVLELASAYRVAPIIISTRSISQ